jgi:drug/metabolite transporter (DMT)-like permease
MRIGRSAGVTLAVLSAATFGTSGAFATSLIDAGWSPAAAVTTRITIAALILSIPAIRALRGRWMLLRRHARMILTYGLVAVAGCQLAYFYAVSHLSVGVALLLEYLGTMLVVGWLWARHGQRPRRLTVVGGLIAVVGLVLVLDLVGDHRLDPIGVLWGLGAAVGLAVYFILSAADTDTGADDSDADSPSEELPPLVLAWGGMAVGSVTLLLLGLVRVLPLRASTAEVHLLHHRVSWVVPVLGLSVIAAAFAYVAGIGAARLLGAKLASFIGLTEVVFAVVFAWLLLGQVPAALQFAGGALIVAGVVLVRLDELRGDVSGVVSGDVSGGSRALAARQSDSSPAPAAM